MGNGCFAKESSSNWYSGGRRSKSSGMISLRLFIPPFLRNGAIEAFLDSVP
jgi:hypothetical protein